MLKVKDTLRATVHLTFDGRVIKAYHGANARERFDNEVRVLRHLAAHDCPFVPRLLDADAEKIRVITSNCGTRVERIDDARIKELFAELETFGVRHDDPEMRNITYRQSDGRFCIIDFEFATILPEAAVKERKQTNDTLIWSGLSDIGKVRKNNEDSFLGLRFDSQEVHRLGKHGDATLADADYAFAVCDGMGGAKAGEFASNIAVEKITTLLPKSFRKTSGAENDVVTEVLTKLFREIHRQLVYLGNSYDECHGMETTLSLCWFTPGRAFFGHIGDSRIYRLAAGAKEIKQLTDDDTHVGWLLRNGQISEREARTHPRRNVLQKAIGGGNQFVDPQVGSVECNAGDVFLLCTDGLTEGIYNGQLTEMLRVEDAHIARTLVETAVKNDGRDNTTALVVRVK
jgi:serine/threonine protein phosphatase PrpC